MSRAPASPSPIQPVGLSHLVLNVRDLERAHRFWTEVLGFRQVGEVEAMKMRFYLGSRPTHHELALVQVADPDDPASAPDEGKPLQFVGARTGVNHIAIQLPDADAFDAAEAWLRESGIAIQSRIDHGMTRSLYLTDPDGHGVELCVDLPRELWEGDLNAALNKAEILER